MKFVKKMPKPIIKPKGFPYLYYQENWQSRWVYHPRVIVRRKKVYLFYSGKSGINMLGNLKIQMRQDIGLAESEDLKKWQIQKNPILSPSEKPEDWDSDLVCHSFVIKIKNKYFMLYDGSKKNSWQESIGLAQSHDLKNWKKSLLNPIFKVSENNWENNHVSRCSLLFHNNEYYLFYAGHDGKRERIGLAKGKNLGSLKRASKKPILDLGKKGEWDSRFISDPKVIKVGSSFLMSYTGFNDQNIQGAIGLAYSNDLQNWRKFPLNPVLSPGSKNSWDGVEAARADLIKVFGGYYFFYTGSDGFSYAIGLAEIDMDKILKVIKNEH